MVTLRKTRTCRAVGFTLLELLVVLTIAGLLIALVPPVISAAVPGTRLKVATRDLATALRGSRNKAVSHGTEINFVIDTDPPRYTIANGTPNDLPVGIDVIVRDTAFIAAVKLSTIADGPSGNTYTVRFYPDGSASGAAIKISQGRSAYRVDVDWLLGSVTVSKAPNDAY